MADRPSTWIFLAVAAVIALVVFSRGQVAHHAGALFALVASLGWCGMAPSLRGRQFRA